MARSLADLAHRAGLRGIDPWYGALAITGITADSRAVQPGFLFAALPGARANGADYIAEAVRRGAAAVLGADALSWPSGVGALPVVRAANPRRALAHMAASFAGAQPRKIVAVTGTNGKTSIVDFVRQLWRAAGLRAASLGTLGLIAPGHAGGASLTTPDPVVLAETMAGLARDAVHHVALEASSHGLDQNRLDGLCLCAAGFSNLTRDHLDYHGSQQAYAQAKLRLFAALLPPRAVAAVNADMNAEVLAELSDIAHKRQHDLRTVGEKGAYYRLVSATALPQGQALVIAANGTQIECELKLPGRFQADNVMLAACLAEATGAPNALHHLAELQGVRGRMELAAQLPNNAAAYVDYAHTPDALYRVLTALRPHAKGGRVVCVFGAGGDRDAGKRPLMGDVVRQYADVAIVTDDNPRSENPAEIRKAILAACPGAHEIGDRAAAISAGLQELNAGDVLVVAGKGHEQGQIIGDCIYPFDDAAVIRQLAGVA